MLEHQAQRHLDHARAAHIGAAIAAVEFRSTAELSKLAIVHGSIARHESEVRVVRTSEYAASRVGSGRIIVRSRC